jgi:hypothetical protein
MNVAVQEGIFNADAVKIAELRLVNPPASPRSRARTQARANPFGPTLAIVPSLLSSPARQSRDAADTARCGLSGRVNRSFRTQWTRRTQRKRTKMSVLYFRVPEPGSHEPSHGNRSLSEGKAGPLGPPFFIRDYSRSFAVNAFQARPGTDPQPCIPTAYLGPRAGSLASIWTVRLPRRS